MSKIHKGFVIGAAVTVLGILLALKAEHLATDWQMIGPDAWGGTTDPDKRHLYQTLGLFIAGFGLFLTGITFYRWLPQTRAGLSEGEPERRPFSPR
jgi:hypothetical protein